MTISGAFMEDFFTINLLVVFESLQLTIISDRITRISTKIWMERKFVQTENFWFHDGLIYGNGTMFLVLKVFLFRFSTMYRQKCHFSFNHLSYFTHENGNNLELYDILVSDALGRMKSAGVFDNTILLIAGDHGQRLVSLNYIPY
jgi:membrane-anchored protein YejM (alkaline phosphatase superfamily)